MQVEKHKKRKPADSLTTISHHVRNPIYILKGYLNALLCGDLGDLDEKQKSYLQVCSESVDRISDIVEDLVQVIEIDEEKYVIKKEKVDLVKLAKEVVENHKFLARAANAKIFFESEEESLIVLTDYTKMSKTLSAFVANAVKYKRPGEGTLEIKIEKKDEEVFCAMKDNGIGVPEEDREKIFKKFYRTEGAIERDPNSLGLSLYFNRKIIEGCGGKVWVEGNEKGGSTFFFTLPITKEE